MVDSSSAVLLAELDQKRKRMRLWPLVGSAGVALFLYLLFSGVSTWLLYLAGIISLLLAIGAYCWDVLKKSVVMVYDLEGDSETAYRKVFDAVNALAGCGATWHISARGNVHEPKYHAGASDLVCRKQIEVAQHDPPYVRTNLSIVRIPAGERVLYFFPDRVLLFTPGGVGSLSYRDLNAEISSTRFIEDDRVQSDATIVDRTWRYVNKSGGPDRRFKDNREIPICEYEQIHLSSKSGLNEQFQASRLGAGGDLQSAFEAMASALQASRDGDVPAIAKMNAKPGPAEAPASRAEIASLSHESDVAQTSSTAASPPETDIYGALLQIMYCVMVADGRVSSKEKTRIKEIMKKVRAPWPSVEVDEQITLFVSEVKTIGYRKVLNNALSSVSWLGEIGRRDVVLKCIEAVASSLPQLNVRVEAF